MTDSTASSGHKRKRSLQDTPVDLTKMQQARRKLEELQNELGNIQETAEEMGQIMAHVDALQEILGSAKQPKLDFSLLTFANIRTMGVQRKYLQIKEDILDQRAKHPDLDQYGQRLCEQLELIYEFVNMQSEGAARMILDSILLAVAQVATHGEAKTPVAIFPKMRIATGDSEGVCITNPVTEDKLYLTGQTGYGLLAYGDKSFQPTVVNFTLESILNMDVATNRIMLVEGKREDFNLADSMPEAIGQAIALCEVSKSNTIRFAISDGRRWIFSLLSKNSDGSYSCYQGGAVFEIVKPRKDLRSALLGDLKKVLYLVWHWLLAKDDPLTDELYVLRDTMELVRK